LASGDWDHRITLWNVPKYDHRTTLLGHSGIIAALQFSNDGKLLASAGANDKTARLWKVSTGEEIKRFTHPSSVTSVGFTGDGGSLITGCEDGVVRVWSINTGKSLKQIRTGGIRMTPSSDGTTLAVTGHVAPREKCATLIDLDKGKESGALCGHEKLVLVAGFSGNGRLLATGGWDKSVVVWDVFR
jgi:WD40 repeat protein